MLFKPFSIALLLLILAPSVFAEDKKPAYLLTPKDVYFQPSGGLRVRYDKLNDGTGKAFSSDEDDSRVQQRAQFDVKLNKGEFFETFFRFIHFSDWGDSNGNSISPQKDAFNRGNGLLVNQAWALWKVDDSLGLHFGRAPLNFGLGFVYGHNDWFNVPYTFDFFDLAWDWESLKLSIVYAKIEELDRVAGQTLSPDPEENHIIINIDVKNMSDSIETFNFNIVQVNRDLGSNDAGVTVLNGLNMQKFSLETALNFRSIFSTLFISYGTGDEKVAPVNQVGGLEEIRISHTALDFKLGYRSQDLGGLRVWGGFHSDSGDKTQGDNESQTFNPLYYNVYGQSGLMDLLRWGNLTFYRFGLDMDVVTGLKVGGEWLSFTRTEDTDGLNFGDSGRFLNNRVTLGDITLGPGKELGSELDVWADWNFQSGVNVRATVATFFPGETFKNAVSTSGSSPSTTIMQFLVQGGYFF